MFVGCFSKNWKAFMALGGMVMLSACNNMFTTDDTAGILIETNTGNKGVARVYVAPELWELAVGDTVSLALSERDTMGDTVYVYENDYRKVVDSLAVETGMFRMDSVPAGEYDSVTVYGQEGVRSYATDLDIEENESYVINSNGVKEISASDDIVSVLEGNAQFYFSVETFGMAEGETLSMERFERKLEGDSLSETRFLVTRVITAEEVSKGVIKVEDVPEGTYDLLSVGGTSVQGSWTLSEKPVFISKNGVSEIDSVRIALPEGFEDLSSVNESFKDMPFPVLLPTTLKNPCLLDAAENTVKLEVAENDYYDSRVLYWGKAPEVRFTAEGDIGFKVLEGCVDSLDGEISMGTYKNHFSDVAISDSAKAKFQDAEALLGNALWLDASDNWFYIDDFKPFSEDGYYMGLSVWFHIDSTQVDEYAQIITAKKDSVGFMLQKHGASGAVNLRLNTKTGGYNVLVGRVNSVLDGTWHNYSFKIHGDSVTTFIDGTLIESVQFDAGEGFSIAYNPVVGYSGVQGGVDELFFFDGTQSQNWMRLFYALQQGVREGL